MKAAENKKYQAVLVTHSHWDREWYRPLEEYRFRLVELVDGLLDILRHEPQYHSFWLDGHTAPLADYLAVRPERAAELRQRLEEGKIRVGPWYVLADEHLVSGEACVRNLLLGMRQARQFGQQPLIGYMPDTFGHIDQLPQILHGFGIDNAFFWRGYSLDEIDGAETVWRGRDGSEVKVVCLVGGYSNTRGVTIDLDNTADRIDAMIERLKKYCASGTLLLMNGIDHALPTPRIGAVIKRLEQRFPEVEIRHGSLDDYLQAVAMTHRQSRPLAGELFQVAGLDGCLSNRPRQKWLNRRLENALAHYAEPLALQAGALAGVPLQPFLRRAWELLLKCHPHDTICGCHADTVARDMEMRLERGLQITTEVERRAISALLGVRNDAGDLGLPCHVALYNPLPWRRGELVTFTLPLPPDVGEVSLRDQGGRLVPSRITQVRQGFYSEFHDYKIPTRTPCLMAEFSCFVQDMAPMGITLLTADEAPRIRVDSREASGGDGAVAAISSLSGRLAFLENDKVRVRVYPDGSCDLFDKRRGLELAGLNQLRLAVDKGDLYRFAPALADQVSAPEPGVLVRTVDTTLCQAVEAQCALRLGAERMPVRIGYALPADKARVEVTVSFDNTLRGFRLQAALPLAGATGRGLAQTPFSLSARAPIAAREAPLYDRDERFRANAVGQPMQSLALFEIGQGTGLALYNRGLYEYTWENRDQPCLTLMRSVGKIIRELAEHDASGGYAPGAQRFEYALGVHDFAAPHLALAEAQEYALPPLALPLHCQPTRVPHGGVEFDNRHWVLTTYKPAEDGADDVIRFWNASDAEESGTVTLPAVYKRAALVRMDETPLREIEIVDGRIALLAQPYAIVTVRLVRGEVCGT